MLGIEDAEHEETAPGAPTLLITKLSCSLVGRTQKVRILPGTIARRAYGREESSEGFYCNYGLNPAHRDALGDGNLRISGMDEQGEVRIVELRDHPFFVATLFLPQVTSSAGEPHPLITAFLRAAIASRARR